VYTDIEPSRIIADLETTVPHPRNEAFVANVTHNDRGVEQVAAIRGLPGNSSGATLVNEGSTDFSCVSD